MLRFCLLWLALVMPQSAVKPFKDIVYAPKTHTSNVTIFLHGRCTDPVKACRIVAEAVTPRSWLLCPVGPKRCQNGFPTWPGPAKKPVEESLHRAVKEHPELASLNYTLIGHSLGAYRALELTEASPFYSRALLIGAKVVPDPDRLVLSRVAMAAGDQDGAAPHMAHQAKLLRSKGHDIKFFSLGQTGHPLPQDFSKRVGPALEYLYGP